MMTRLRSLWCGHDEIMTLPSPLGIMMKGALGAKRLRKVRTVFAERLQRVVRSLTFAA